MPPSPQKNAEILLESGTNELEVLVFTLGGQRFGVNVAKVREVIHSVEITASPEQPEAVQGMFSLRGSVLPLVNLHTYLDIESHLEDSDHQRVIVTEFNGTQGAFAVEDVDSIYRMSWKDMRPVPEATGDDKFAITGIAEIGEELIMMLDFESIYDHIAMSDNLHVDIVDNDLGIDRGSRRILIAEDSNFIRGLILNVLKNSGYTDIIICTDGAKAWNYMVGVANGENPAPDLVITDIEMPQMDGLHFCKRVKEIKEFETLPVLLFSSLITRDTLHKGKQVGAAGQMAKPDVLKLVQTVDQIFAGTYQSNLTDESVPAKAA